MLLPVYFLLLRRPRPVLWSVGVVAALFLIAIVRFPFPQGGHISHWVYWLGHGNEIGANIDPGSNKISRFQMVNLRAALYTFGHHRLLVDTLNWLICLFLGVTAAVAINRRQHGAADRSCWP